MKKTNWVLISVVVCCASASAAQQEKLIRQTYAKLEGYNAAAQVLQNEFTRRPFKAEANLRFELGGFRSGDIKEILNKPYASLMTLPTGDADYSRRWSLIKRRFTTAAVKAGLPVPRHRNGEYVLWQRRYWEHTIRNDRDFEQHVDYIHFNPVKHGHVSRTCDWPHSSFRRYVARGLVPLDWGGDVRDMTGAFGE